MTTIVPRTCTELKGRDTERPIAKPRPLSAFRDYPAYVLLGDPGAGKTTAFEAEATIQSDALKVTARDFITFDAESDREWRGKTLFIDGLDEVRAGTDDKRPPLDQIRRKLDKFGRPRFRLSCRAADWLGNNDAEKLATVSPSGLIAVLRLDPLTESDATQILRTKNGIEDPRAFVAEARHRGLGGLLANPLTLDMLAKAESEGSLPDSRLDAFDRACRMMVTEHNDEHLSARPLLETDPTLDTAGRLCATLILSGAAGCARDPNVASEDYPAVTACGRGDADCRAAVATKLFSYHQDGRATPVHRHIAEFLGARHLASVIRDGLPGGRVLALMTGADGGIVTQLRGLSGWLAAHSPEIRLDLVQRDPIGVGLYGDIRDFSLEEKHVLLDSLTRVPRQLAPELPTTAFASLAIVEMCDEFRRLLEQDDRHDDHRRIVDFVLRLLTKATEMPPLAPVLLQVVRDPTWWPDVKRPAVRTYIQCARDPDRTASLNTLLTEMENGDIRDDPDHGVLATLLSALYPTHVPPSQVWTYLKEPSRIFMGPYYVFWTDTLHRQSSDDQVAALLDAAVPRIAQLRKTLAANETEHTLVRLVARGLVAHGDNMPVGKIYDWLGLGIDDYKTDFYSDDVQSIAHIRDWLEARPRVLRAIVKEGVARCTNAHGSSYFANEIDARLFGARSSPELDLCRLDEAVSIASSKPKAAGHLVRQVLMSNRIDIGLLQARTQRDAKLAAMVKEWTAPPPEREPLDTRRQMRIEERPERRKWIDHIRANKMVLRANRASPMLLYRLSRTYFRSFVEANAERRASTIEAHVEHDSDLSDAILTGLRLAVFRDDIPDVDEVVDLLANNRMHPLGWPFLAGLAEAERIAPLDDSDWTEDRKRKALAFYFAYAHGDYEPGWYSQLLQTHPETVADVQLRLAKATLHNRIKDTNTNLWHLAHDAAHRPVARLTALPLLRAFPSRCRQERFAILDNLLWAAVQHADPMGFADLVARKLSLNSMMPTQRAHWLAAGCAVAPDQYVQLIENHLQTGRSEERIRHFAAFFCPDDKVSFHPERLGVAVLALLTRLTGRCFGPQWSEGRVTPAMKASGLVFRFIRCLEADPSQAASAQLESLGSDPSLERWHAELTLAADRQRVIRRDHSYRPPSVEGIQWTLADETPANASDLAALVTDRIRRVGVHIKNGNANDWRPYWNEDSYGNRDKPKHEESCRDAFLVALRPTLPRGVDAQPEGRYANRTRADIRVAYRDFHVPVEVKKNDSRDLWSAPRGQLFENYASDPATGGYGIYVVFWFGSATTQPPPVGARPKTPADLKSRLDERLTQDKSNKIAVCVIDVEP